MGPAVEKCPICGAANVSLLKRISFLKKSHLPDDAPIYCCEPCDFIFVRTAASQQDYRNYYASTANDTYSDLAQDSYVRADGMAERYGRQAAEIVASFAVDARIDILDYGCGSGALLKELSSRGFDSLYGVDFAPQSGWEPSERESDGQRPRFLLLDHEGGVPAAVSDMRFDLIIVSHVLEHLVEFDVLAKFFDLLKPGGCLYIEVPDAARYHEFERLEFFYYFDRLHVNHFSCWALKRLLSGFGFGLYKSFRYRFAYSGGDFPALGCFFHKAGSVQSVMQAFRQYTADEIDRARRLRDRMATVGLPLLVYGAGDNFHRNFNVGGPLTDLEIGCVLDRNHAMFPGGVLGIPVLDPAEGLRRYPGSPIAVAVSSGRREVRQLIQSIDTTGREIFDV